MGAARRSRNRRRSGPRRPGPVAETAVQHGGIDRRRWLARIGLVAGGAVFLLYLGMWAIWIRGGSEGSDYTAFYTGWSIVAHGDGASLYDPVVQAATQKD